MESVGVQRGGEGPPSARERRAAFGEAFNEVVEGLVLDLRLDLQKEERL